MNLPDITAIQRWQIQPGDRLIVRTDRRIDPETSQMLQERVRAILQLPAEVPIMVLDGDWSAGVVNHERS